MCFESSQINYESCESASAESQRFSKQHPPLPQNHNHSSHHQHQNSNKIKNNFYVGIHGKKTRTSLKDNNHTTISPLVTSEKARAKRNSSTGRKDVLNDISVKEHSSAAAVEDVDADAVATTLHDLATNAVTTAPNTKLSENKTNKTKRKKSLNVCRKIPPTPAKSESIVISNKSKNNNNNNQPGVTTQVFEAQNKNAINIISNEIMDLEKTFARRHEVLECDEAKCTERTKSAKNAKVRKADDKEKNIAINKAGDTAG